jgi:polar amino acid transport system substrate-binding protein
LVTVSGDKFRLTTYQGAKLMVTIILWIAASLVPVHAQDATQLPEPGFGFPQFRQSDPDQAQPPDMSNRAVTLLTDQDFAPWSFVGSDGRMQGVSVDLAFKACADLGLVCGLKALPFESLRAALAKGEGDVIISGLRAETSLLDESLPTRPYFLSLGRFVTRQGTSLPSSDPRALEGKRVGYVRNSTHGVFLQKHFARATLTAYDRLASVQEALRTGAIDAGFGDATALAFWLSGSSARNCCQALGKAFVDRDSFSRGLFFSVRKDAGDLRDGFDAALDGLEERGETARVFTSYLPMALW